MAESIADKVTITICGDGGCGKSSITLRLVRSQWTEEYDPTIEDSYSVTRQIDGLSYNLCLTDTAGQEEYRSLWAASNLSSDAFMLVYDITSPSSLDGLTWFLDMIAIEAENRIEENNRLLRERGTRVKGKRDEGWRVPPICIVAGNKCDLKEKRVISSKAGWEWARARGCGFMETSAREMVNIEETFAWIVRKVVDNRRQELGATAAAAAAAAASSAGTASTVAARLKSHTTQASAGATGTGPYTMPKQMQASPPAPNANTTQTTRYNEKSVFESEPPAPWWKKMLSCSCM